MSGGSFNYLCDKDALEILMTGMGDLAEMADALEGMGHLAQEPAERTRALHDRLRDLQDELDAEVQSLSPVWKAKEWWQSCDWGPDQFWKAVGVWEERQRATASASKGS